MSMNGVVRFGPSLAQTPRIGRILHLGYISPTEQIVTMPEGAGMLVGGGLLIAGSQVKGKGGLLMMILGGLAALAGAGSAAYRAVAKPTGSIVPLPAAPAKPAGTAAQVQNIVTSLAPQITPLLKNLFSSSPTPAPAPAPAAMVTSYSQLAPAPAPAASSDFVTDYGD